MTATVGLVVRPAGPLDARAIAEVHVASWRWAYADDLPASLLDGLSVDEREVAYRQQLEEPASSVRLVVAEDGSGRVVGFASTGPTPDEDAAAGTGALYAIYLLAEAAGVGVGRALLERATADLVSAGFTRATLWVLATNERARRFYDRAGWVWDGTTGEHRFDCANRPIVRYAVDLTG